MTAGLNQIDCCTLIVAWRILFHDGDAVVSLHELFSLPPLQVWNGIDLVVSSTTVYGIGDNNIPQILLTTDKDVVMYSTVMMLR